MKDESRTKKQLVEEHQQSSRRISELEKSEAGRIAAEKALESSERKLSLFMQQTLFGVIEWNSELIVNEWNPGAEAIFGYRREEALGRHASELIVHEEIIGDIDAVWNKLLKQAGGQYNRNENITKDGRRILCEWFNTPLVAHKGNVIGAVSLVHDITERMRMENALKESESRYRAIFETTGAATLIVEEDATICLVNSEFEKITGYSKDEIEGKLCWTVFIPWEEELRRLMRFHLARRINAAGAPSRYETRISDRHGNTRDILINVAMIPGTARSVATFMDISDRKRDEEALLIGTEELKSKTRELEDMNAALRVILQQREKDKTDLEERVLASVMRLVMPHVERLKTGLSGGESCAHVHMIESSLKGIVAPFAQQLSSKFYNLTPKEILVANLIREGKTTKEIACIMNLSRFAIDTHRAHLRRKLGLKSEKTNLRNYLSFISK